MKPLFSAFSMAACVLCSTALPAEDLGPRVGLTFYGILPADTAGRIYGHGWKAGLNIFVRRGEPTEGRVRLEFGNFAAGKEVLEGTYRATTYSAQSRLVGYDWLISLGDRRSTGVDAIVGIGGAHWFQERRSRSLPGNPWPYSDDETDHKLGFAATFGFRFRIAPQFHLEVHHVFTSLPGSDRDFKDAELSHTALGVGFRF